MRDVADCLFLHGTAMATGIGQFLGAINKLGVLRVLCGFSWSGIRQEVLSLGRTFAVEAFVGR